MAATVFVFTGRAYYAHPGLDWQMTIVQEDYVATCQFKGTWKQAQAWMCKHGYRKLWGTPAQDGCDGTQVWGLVSVFGEEYVRYSGPFSVRAHYERWLAEHQPKKEQPCMTERMMQQLARARVYEACQYANAHPELSAHEVNEMMKARACGNV